MCNALLITAIGDVLHGQEKREYPPLRGSDSKRGSSPSTLYSNLKKKQQEICQCQIFPVKFPDFSTHGFSTILLKVITIWKIASMTSNSYSQKSLLCLWCELTSISICYFSYYFWVKYGHPFVGHIQSVCILSIYFQTWFSSATHYFKHFPVLSVQIIKLAWKLIENAFSLDQYWYELIVFLGVKVNKKAPKG